MSDDAAPKVLFEKMLAGLDEAADLFRYYEKCHRGKGTADGNQKAERNRAMAEKLEAIIDEAIRSE